MTAKWGPPAAKAGPLRGQAEPAVLSPPRAGKGGNSREQKSPRGSCSCITRCLLVGPYGLRLLFPGQFFPEQGFPISSKIATPGPHTQGQK